MLNTIILSQHERLFTDPGNHIYVFLIVSNDSFFCVVSSVVGNVYYLETNYFFKNKTEIC